MRTADVVTDDTTHSASDVGACIRSGSDRSLPNARAGSRGRSSGRTRDGDACRHQATTRDVTLRTHTVGRAKRLTRHPSRCTHSTISPATATRSGNMLAVAICVSSSAMDDDVKYPHPALQLPSPPPRCLFSSPRCRLVREHISFSLLSTLD